jgi:hypothetical protein
VASEAACIFSLTISLASRRAFLLLRISFIIRSATTPFASTASIIKELNIRRPLQKLKFKIGDTRIVPILEAEAINGTFGLLMWVGLFLTGSIEPPSSLMQGREWRSNFPCLVANRI